MLERRRTHARRVACGIVATLALGWTAAARAQTTSDSAAAQELFEAAKKLVAQKDYRDACPKFAASQKLDPQPGTEFNLADCYEHVGRSASAWVAFVDVADQLKVRGDAAREKVARDRAAALQPKLTRLAIAVKPEARVQGLVVKRDGEVVREAQWGIAVPVDPGDHAIAASAPGMKDWASSVTAQGAGQTANVEVPKLEPAPVAAASSPPAPAPAPSQPERPISTSPAVSSGGAWSTQKTLGLLVGGVGIVGVAVGGIFGLQAFSKHSQYADHCPNNVCTDPADVQTHDDAVSAGNVATIATLAGVALVATGAVLWFTAPKGTAKTGVYVAPSLGGAVAGGSW